MKRNLAIIVFAILAITYGGCNKTQPDQKDLIINVSKDTGYEKLSYEMKTEPRFSCNLQKLPDPKLLYFKSWKDTIPMQVQIKDTVSAEELAKQGYYHFPNKGNPVLSNSNAWNWSFIPAFLKWLLYTALACFVLWMLVQLLRRVSRDRIKNKIPSSSEFKEINTDGILGGKQEQSKNFSSTTSSFGKEDYVGIKEVISQLQKTPAGGSVTLGPLSIVIPTVVPNIHVDASKGGTIGDITITIDTSVMNVTDNMIDYYESDDQRSNGSGTDKKE